MAISIRNPRVEKLAREIGEKENLSMTQAILNALEEKLDRLKTNKETEKLRLQKLRAIADQCSSLPVLDSRSPDEILGYDETGIF